MHEQAQRLPRQRGGRGVATARPGTCGEREFLPARRGGHAFRSLQAGDGADRREQQFRRQDRGSAAVPGVVIVDDVDEQFVDHPQREETDARWQRDQSADRQRQRLRCPGFDIGARAPQIPEPAQQPGQHRHVARDRRTERREQAGDHADRAVAFVHPVGARHQQHVVEERRPVGRGRIEIHQAFEIGTHQRPRFLGDIELADAARERGELGVGDRVELRIGERGERAEFFQHAPAERPRCDTVRRSGDQPVARGLVQVERQVRPQRIDVLRGGAPDERQPVQQQLQRRFGLVHAPAAVVEDARALRGPGRDRLRRQIDAMDDVRLQAGRRDARFRQRGQFTRDHVADRPVVAAALERHHADIGLEREHAAVGQAPHRARMPSDRSGRRRFGGPLDRRPAPLQGRRRRCFGPLVAHHGQAPRPVGGPLLGGAGGPAVRRHHRCAKLETCAIGRMRHLAFRHGHHLAEVDRRRQRGSQRCAPAHALRRHRRGRARFEDVVRQRVRFQHRRLPTPVLGEAARDQLHDAGGGDGAAGRRAPVVQRHREAHVDVAGEQHHRSIARQRRKQRLEGRGLVGPGFGIDALQQPREALERQQREFHPFGSEHRHAGDHQGQPGVVLGRVRQHRGHGRIAEQAGRTLVVNAAGLAIAGGKAPPRPAIEHDDPMARSFDPIGKFHQRPERRHRFRGRGERQAQQFLQAVRARAPLGRWRRQPGRDPLQQFGFDPGRPPPRVVAPALHQRERHEAVADDVHAERAGEDRIAPLPAEIPVVRDFVIVCQHVRGHVRQRAAHARQAVAETAHPPVEQGRRPVLARDPRALLFEIPLGVRFRRRRLRRRRAGRTRSLLRQRFEQRGIVGTVLRWLRRRIDVEESVAPLGRHQQRGRIEFRRPQVELPQCRRPRQQVVRDELAEREQVRLAIRSAHAGASQCDVAAERGRESGQGRRRESAACIVDGQFLIAHQHATQLAQYRQQHLRHIVCVDLVAGQEQLVRARGDPGQRAARIDQRIDPERAVAPRCRRKTRVGEFDGAAVGHRGGRRRRIGGPPAGRREWTVQRRIVRERRGVEHAPARPVDDDQLVALFRAGAKRRQLARIEAERNRSGEQSQRAEVARVGVIALRKQVQIVRIGVIGLERPRRTRRVAARGAQIERDRKHVQMRATLHGRLHCGLPAGAQVVRGAARRRHVRAFEQQERDVAAFGGGDPHAHEIRFDPPQDRSGEEQRQRSGIQ